MVSSDKRLEVMEDELKLLKGEVKRTLVDLRAFIMREDSPLNERVMAIRDPIRDRGDQLGGEISQATANIGNLESDRRVEALEEEMKTLRSERARAESTPPPMPGPQPSFPTAPVQPPAATPGPQPSFPTAPVQPPAATPAYGPSYQQQQPPAFEGPPEFRERPVPPPTQRAQDPSGNIRFKNAQFENSRFVGEPDQPSPSELEEPQSQDNEDQSSQSSQETRGRRRRREQPEKASPDFSDDPPERGRHYLVKEPARTYERRNGHQSEFEEIEEDDWSPSHPSDGGSTREPAMGQEALDVNLIANLVRWAFQAKRHMGQERLMDFLTLYLHSGHHPPGLRETIVYISSMVEEEPAYEADTTQEFVDFMHQLHGILAGGIPITHIPGMKFSDGERAETVHSKVEKPALGESKGTFTREA